MMLFRKKPVVIEAVQWTGSNVFEVYSFLHGRPSLDTAAARDRWIDFENLYSGKEWPIKTLEDGANNEAKHVASVGDWIIKGVQGEFYPCKPDIFAATYEPATVGAPVSSQAASCQCEACQMNGIHASDCAVHNEPAYPNGPCDCGAAVSQAADQSGDATDMIARSVTTDDWIGRQVAQAKAELAAMPQWQQDGIRAEVDRQSGEG